MEFRDLKKQYISMKNDMDLAIQEVLQSGNYIAGKYVVELEEKLADYVGRDYCVTCANGTDALEIALRAAGVKSNDAVFVPDFTFFSTGEVVAAVGAMPVFVDVLLNTCNMDADSLEHAVKRVLAEGIYQPKAIMAVDLFGQTADYRRITAIAKKYNLLLIEDGAQGFGGGIGAQRACSFGDISTTSFFPSKPLGCYGDGGAIFTDSPQWNETIRSLCVHGKSGNNKYENVQIGKNSRLDSIQAAILLVKFKYFKQYELECINSIAQNYTEQLEGVVTLPSIEQGFTSSWAQYTIQLQSEEERQKVQVGLKERNIPSMVYYPKTMHQQTAFQGNNCITFSTINAEQLCKTVLSLPISPYLAQDEQNEIIQTIKMLLG